MQKKFLIFNVKIFRAICKTKNKYYYSKICECLFCFSRVFSSIFLYARDLAITTSCNQLNAIKDRPESALELALDIERCFSMRDGHARTHDHPPEARVTDYRYERC